MNKNMILRYAAAAATAVIIAVIMIYVQATEAYAQTGIPLDTTDITIERGQTYTVSNKEELLKFDCRLCIYCRIDCINSQNSSGFCFRDFNFTRPCFNHQWSFFS